MFSYFLLLIEYFLLEGAKNSAFILLIFFFSIFSQNCNQMNMKPCFRTILAGLAFPC